VERITRHEPLLPTLEIAPRGRADGSIIVLHGLGANGHQMAVAIPFLRLPQVRFVFPHAPARRISIRDGALLPAWHDLTPAGACAEDVAASARRIESLIEREQQRGVPASRIVLAGFSQGGAMALHVGTRYRKTLLGLVVISAYEPLAQGPDAAAANRRTPILFCHGTRDAVVDIEHGRRAYHRHAQPGRPVEWQEFPVDHEVSLEMLAVVGAWLRGLFDGALERRARKTPLPASAACLEGQLESA
jgi:phospholipase/carboxylesterase